MTEHRQNVCQCSSHRTHRPYGSAISPETPCANGTSWSAITPLDGPCPVYITTRPHRLSHHRLLAIGAARSSCQARGYLRCLQKVSAWGLVASDKAMQSPHRKPAPGMVDDPLIFAPQLAVIDGNIGHRLPCAKHGPPRPGGRTDFSDNNQTRHWTSTPAS